MQTSRQTKKQINRHTNMHTNRHTDRQTDWEIKKDRNTKRDSIVHWKRDKDIKVQFNQSQIFARWIIKAGILIWEFNQNEVKVFGSQGLNPINNKLVWIKKMLFRKKTVSHSKAFIEFIKIVNWKMNMLYKILF